MLVVDHALATNGRPLPIVTTPNMGGRMTPRLLVIHYTAGTTAEGAVRWLADPAARASAHLVIGRDGACHQMVPFNRCAWHAGRSRWGEITGLNSCSIGIELVNAGKLVRGANSRWLGVFKQPIAEDDVLVATHKNESQPAGWQRYPRAQLDTLVTIGRALCDAYGLAAIVGHDDIAPRRKVDPGPAFPMGDIATAILGQPVAA